MAFDATFFAFVGLVLFLLLLVYLKVPGMMASSLDKRAANIREELDQAKRLREEAQALLAEYQRKAVTEIDPFVTLDQKGVGEMISIAIDRGKTANPKLKIGICGEHAGDPASLRFFAGLPIDYVSCSPYRVPVARLTLAQAAD